MDYGTLTCEEITSGYRFDAPLHAYRCNYCNGAFTEGQIYDMDGTLYDAVHAVQKHIDTSHGGNFTQLLQTDSKYNTLTENQRALLALFYAGKPDKDIAAQLGISVSTVRHQKFTFREKAKQAKHFLAVFEQAFDGKPVSGDSLVPIHENAAFYDDRYIITEQEKNHVLESDFESLQPLRLKRFPRKEKKKVVILTTIAGQFQQGLKYTEKEVNDILKAIYDDFTTLRRYLIMYGFMEREQDGSSYWLA